MTPEQQHDTLVTLVETIRHLAESVSAITERLNRVPTRDEMNVQFVTASRFDALEAKLEKLQTAVTRNSLGTAFAAVQKVAVWITAFAGAWYLLVEAFIRISGRRP